MAGKRTDKFDKFNTKKREKYLALLRQGGRRCRTARACGVSRTLVWDYCKEHPEFRAEVEEAEQEANEIVEDALFKAAKKGNVVACQVWLYNRDPSRWKDRRHLAVESLSDEELIAAVARARRGVATPGHNGNGVPPEVGGASPHAGSGSSGTNGLSP